MSLNSQSLNPIRIMSKVSILVVEDDPSIRFGLTEVLTHEGYEVAVWPEGVGVLEAVTESLPDLIVLDVMLPGVSGYEIARELRKQGCRIPVLMLTARGQELDKVVGLQSGADDYVTKPFGVNELLARIEALLRRSRDWFPQPQGAIGGSKHGNLPIVQVGKAQVNMANFEISLHGVAMPLTPRERDLIRFLDLHRGVVLSRDRLLEEVWGLRYFGTTRALDQCIAQVRKKIGDDGRTPIYLQTIHGVGYKLNA